MQLEESKKLLQEDELMQRQVHPNLMQEDRPSSGIFTPTKIDKGLLSADRGTMINPKDAYERYLKLKNLKQGGGTWGVSIEEFTIIGLSCYSDPIENNDAHALINFASLGAINEKGLGKLAYLKATARGRLFP